ncbi:hypothetical protein H696_03275 [Fonticula alba]|uniref:Uncharacterized protein n=1 Tax=Fonticula alba TaxID=691883 RepID=A0A058Z6B9_FONAL|nr:hypothetical protein H696_03275 [Fonticula alba]KCV69815.1 hypothetical protein H696_03275 [Fonticula alba]|eukprot:XP_009495421.1 hypothetical protein H696_03275 [Fonticula alba]
MTIRFTHVSSACPAGRLPGALASTAPALATPAPAPPHAPPARATTFSPGHPV